MCMGMFLLSCYLTNVRFHLEQRNLFHKGIFGLAIYSQVANRRGGRLLIFENFPTPPELIRTPPLINFPEKSF